MTAGTGVASGGTPWGRHLLGEYMGRIPAEYPAVKLSCIKSCGWSDEIAVQIVGASCALHVGQRLG